MTGGGRTNWRTGRRALGGLLQQAGAGTDSASYNAQVNNFLDESLVGYNSRDVSAIQLHINSIKQVLNDMVEGTLEMVYGGSVDKHTYVDGLSDIDLLVRLNDTSLEGKTPQQVMTYFASRLRERLPEAQIEVGTLSVKVKFADGHQIQLLPAVVTATGVRITSATGNGWSNVIRPEAFARKLTEVNQRCAGKVVPVTKLFKVAITESLPEDVRPTGYHAESLAIRAFEKYDGPRTYKDMLLHLCRVAVEAVKSPIADRTGQSLHVDDRMGQTNSQARLRASSFFDRLVKRIENAERQQDRTFWGRLFSERRE